MGVSKPREKSARERYGRLLRDNHGVIGFLVATKETIISLLK